MGFVKKVVGDITGANAQADQQRRAAEDAAAATRAAAEQAATASREAAKQSATQVQMSQERATALSQSAEATKATPDNPDVQVADTQVAGAARKRRAKFGIGSAGTGVNI